MKLRTTYSNRPRVAIELLESRRMMAVTAVGDSFHVRPNVDNRLDVLANDTSDSGQLEIISSSTEISGAKDALEITPSSGFRGKSNYRYTVGIKEQKLISGDEQGEQLGDAIDVSGDYAIVGGEADDNRGSDAGAAYLFQRTSSGWTKIKTFFASDAAGNDHFGYSVAIDGNWVVVGAYGDDNSIGSNAGAAYIFHKDHGGIGNWGQTKKIVSSGGVFGRQVAISGATIAVSEATGVRIFERQQGGPDNWGEVRKISQASDQIALDGDTVITSGGGIIAADEPPHIYSRNMGGPNNWGHVKMLTSSQPHGFGYRLAISGETIVVGARNSLQAHIFGRNVGGTDTWGLIKTLSATSSDTDGFGLAVAIDGDTLAVGAPYSAVKNSYGDGRVKIFERNRGGSDAWGFVKDLTQFDIDDDARYGRSVALAGTTLVVGAGADGDSTGSVYVDDLRTSTATIEVTVGYLPAEVLMQGSIGSSQARSHIKVIDLATGHTVIEFSPYGSSFKSQVRIAIADLNNDGDAELIAAPGSGRDGLVKVFDTFGNELPQYRINAYEKSFTGGVFVAAADVNGDGWIDIVTTPGSGRASEIRVWRNRLGMVSSNPDPFTSTPFRSFLAIGASYTGGVSVAAGDLTGDGKAEVIMGVGPGTTAIPRVRVFDLTQFAQSSTLKVGSFITEILPFNSTDRGGVYVAVGNVRDDDTPEIVIGNGRNGRGRVEVYSAGGTRLKSFTAYSDATKNAPVLVAVKNFDADALGEIVTGQGSVSSRLRRIWNHDGSLVDELLEGDPDFANGFFLA